MTSLLAGAKAGLVATLTMTAVMAAAKAVGVVGEPPPKKLTRRLLTLVGMRPRSDTRLHLATTLAHAGFGAVHGAMFGLLPRPLRSPLVGAAFGLGIWAYSYAGWIPKVRLMPQPRKDRTGRPTAMILAHIVYGLTLGRAMERRA